MSSSALSSHASAPHRAVVFANGSLEDPQSALAAIQAGDLLVAADGGGKHCLRLGLWPHLLVGDLDSLDPDSVSLLEAHGTEVIRYPERKDFTDLELALQHACQQGVEEILIFGALGLRWDQTLANLLMPALPSFQPVAMRLLDGPQEIRLIHPGATVLLEGQPGDTVSLIPIHPHTGGITTQGLEYPLQDEALALGSSRGVSNVLLGERASVLLQHGLLLCVVIHQS